MTLRWLPPMIGIAALAGCLQPAEEPRASPFVEVGPELRALADPSQDLGRVLIEADRCYWRLYRGPVETTYLPVLSRDGRPICLPAEPEPEAEASSDTT